MPRSLPDRWHVRTLQTAYRRPTLAVSTSTNADVGTANVFLFVDVNRPCRHAKVTDRRTCRDFAEFMRDLVDVHYPTAERIRVTDCEHTFFGLGFVKNSTKLTGVAMKIPRPALRAERG